jgi:hypothetical protein
MIMPSPLEEVHMIGRENIKHREGHQAMHGLLMIISQKEAEMSEVAD